MIKEEIVNTRIEAEGFKKVQSDILGIQKTIAGYSEEIKDLKYQKAMLVAEGKKESQEYKNVTARIKELTNNVNIEKVGLEKLTGSLNMTYMSHNQLKKRAEELKRELNNTSQAINPEKWAQLDNQLKQVERQIDKVKIGMRHASDEVKVIPSFWGNTFSKVKNFLPAVGISSLISQAMGSVASWLKSATPAFREYDDKLADVMKTTGLTKDQTEALSRSLKNINTRTSQLELLDLARVAGKLGIEGEKDVEGFVRAADKINVALSEDLGGNAEEALNQIGKLVDIFGIKQQYGIEDAMIRIGSAINEAGAASTANEGYIVEFTKRLAGVAPQANISIQNVIGLGATLDQFGQQCETSGTAVSQAITGMFKKTDVYARIAGMSIGDFTKLMNQDANAAFIAMLKGLKGNNDGMVAMVKNLNDLKMDGSRTTQILGALAANIGTLESQQALANQSFEEGTSILDEFNIKNNTAQAQYEKSKKILKDWSVEIGRSLQPAIQNLTNALADMAQSSAKNLQDEYERYKTTTAEIRKKGDAVDSLTTTYYKLKMEADLSDSQQHQLNETIKRLAEICPSAVTEYTAYGEALDVNISKLKESIRLQDMMNKLQGRKIASKAIDSIKDDWSDLGTAARRKSIMSGMLKDRENDLLNSKGDEISIQVATSNLKEVQKIYDVYDQSVTNLNGDIQSNISLLRDQGMSYTEISKQSGISIDNTIGIMSARIKSEINNLRSLGKGYADIAEEIGMSFKSVIDIASSDSNYDRTFKSEKEKPVSSSSSSGDDKNKWSLDKDEKFRQEKLALQKKYNSGEITSEDEFSRQLLALEASTFEARIATNQEKGEELLTLQQSLEEKRSQQRKDREDQAEKDQERLDKLLAASLDGGKNPDLQQQLDQEAYNYEKRLKDLDLFGVKRENMTKDELAAIENLEKNHLAKKQSIYMDHTLNEFNEQQAALNRSVSQMKIVHNAEIADADSFEKKKALLYGKISEEERIQIRTNKQADKAIRNYYDGLEQEEVKAQLITLLSKYKEYMDEAKKITSTGAPKLNDNEVKRLQAIIDDLEKQLAELRGVLSDSKTEVDSGVSILGFDAKSWEEFEERMEKGKLKLQDWQMMLQVVGQAFGEISKLMSAAEQREFKEYERTATKKKKLLEKQKTSGLITEELYNSKIRKMDEETEQRRTEMERKQAVRDRALAVFQAMVNTAVGVTAALKLGPIMGPILAALIGSLGAVQIAAILTTPLPGVEKGGLINVQREQDGKEFYAEFSPGRRGYVNRPTVIVGENGPEYVIPHKMLANPEVSGFVNTLEAARLRGNFRNPLNRTTIPGRASGGYVANTISVPTGAITGTTVTSQSDDILRRNTEIMEKMLDRLDRPIPAYVRKYGQGGLYDSMHRDTLIRKQL